MIDAQFTDPAANTSPIAEEADTQTIYPGNDPGARQAVPQPVEPIRQRQAAVGGLILANSHWDQCSLKATGINSTVFVSMPMGAG